MPNLCFDHVRWRAFRASLLALGVACLPLAAQTNPTGVLVGRVISSASGDAVAGATVQIEKLDRTSTADLNGEFRFDDLAEDTYELSVTHDGFRQSVVTDVIVVAGATVRHTVPLSSGAPTFDLGDISPTTNDEVIRLEAMTVSGTVTQGSALALLSDRQKASAISDAIGEDDFSRYALGDAADAMGKVTGASVVDGKYVLIRGLGDRYSNTLLNNTAVPSADPDRRAVQMDQFPASLLESIVTSKSFTADQPGGFSGGSVNLRTKNFPEQRFVAAGLSVSYNPQVTGKDMLVVPGGERDWLGRDDGTRALPDDLPARIPSQTEARIAAQAGNFGPAEDLDRASRSFHNDTYFPGTAAGDLNFSSNVSFGDRHEWGNDRRFGYVFSLTYNRSNDHFDRGAAARYSQGSVNPESPSFVNGQLVYTPDYAGLDLAGDYEGNPDVPGGEPRFGVAQSSQRVDWGAYGQVAFKPSLNHEFVLRYLRNQSGDDRVKRGVGESTRSDAGRLYEIFELLYTERSVSSLQLAGESLIPMWNDTRVEWRASRAQSTQDQPDYRSLSYFWDFANQQYASASGVGNNRFFRDLTEDSDEFGADVYVPLEFGGRSATLKFGGVWQDGGRVYRERRFRWSREANQRELIENYPNPVGIATRTANSVTFGNTISELPNNLVNYDGDQTITAAYAQMDVALTSRWRVVAGLRGEKTEISTAPATTGTTFRSAVINQTDALPAVSVVYEVRPEMNVRAAFGRTLARPLYRELADIRVEDAFNGEFFAGNPDLELTSIDNLDLRWEWFPGANELLAASVFYKKFQDPIEVITGSGSIQPRNLESGEVRGIELEARFGLGRFGRWGDRLSFGGNLSFIDSDVAIPADELASIRQVFPDAADTRELTGQSNFIGNIDLSFAQSEWGTSATVAYNFVGDRLSLVTPGPLPDVYEQAAPEIDVMISQRLGTRWRLKFAAKNLLDATREKTLTHAGRDYYYERYRRGREFTLGLSYFFE